MEIKIKTTFSKARIESFYKFHFKHISSYPVVEFALVALCVVIACLGVFVFEDTLTLGICLVVGVVIPTTRNYRIGRTIEKRLKVSPPDSEPYHLIITDDGVKYIRDCESKMFTWDKIVRVCEIDLCFYIYVGNEVALIFPKYTIREEQKEELRKLFTGKNLYKKYKFLSTLDKEGVV